MLKEQLYRFCHTYITNREAEIKKLITDIRDAAGNETKSSAGDKYETTREVMQQEIDLNLTRLYELDKLKATLTHISPTQQSPVVQPGSIVYTNCGNFYIAIRAGRVNMDNSVFYAISATSPIGTQLIGHSIGHSFQLNNKTFTIQRIV